MLLKTIIIFLAAMALLGMIGKWLFPGVIGRRARKRRTASTCPKCGRYMIGRSTCDCGRKG